MLRHKRNKHKESYNGWWQAPMAPPPPPPSPPPRCNMTFQHPFTMVVAGPTGSGKTSWMQQLLGSTLIQPPLDRIIWCYGQWQSTYDRMKADIPQLEFVKGIPSNIEYTSFVDSNRCNLIVFDDLMSNTKCDQRVADLFTKGAHHRNLSVVCLNQNLFPQGKACRDIALNTQYLVLFNNPIDRQQISNISTRIFFDLDLIIFYCSLEYNTTS